MSYPIPAIIVVEDAPDVLLVLRRVLHDLQLRHDIIAVDHAESALAQAERSQCALLITDYMLGDGDGLALAQTMRARYHCKTILLTAYASPELRQAAAAAGIDHFLAKPFPVTELEAVIRRLLNMPAPPRRSATDQST